jgi:glycosyltransferase involved in cell wall biosynthesis
MNPAAPVIRIRAKCPSPLARLDPAIHVFYAPSTNKDVDPRVKPRGGGYGIHRCRDFRTAPAALLTRASVPSSPPKLLFLVTEDWYFCSHRLPVARAARDAGFAVTVATRVRAHGGQIRGEGFALHPLTWKRRGDGVAGHRRALAEIVRLYRAEQPDILYHVALKPALFGGLAARLAFRRRERPAVVSAVMGLGSSVRAPWRRLALGWALRFLAGGGDTVVQNPEDRAALARFGFDPRRIALIRGSGVDTAHFAALPDPGGSAVTVALVGRMLKSKGVPEAVEAVRRLRAGGQAVDLLLAGAPDSGSRDSLTEAELAAFAREPGVEWLGHVADVREVWRRAAIAVLPSSYGEGVPKALLEAAASGRPVIASDTPGCRDVVVPGETGLLTPPRDVAALVAAIRELAADPALRARMGAAGRARAVAEFGEETVAAQTVALLRSVLGERGKR